MGFTPSGKQFEIASAQQRATIVEVGGGVREYSVGARAVLDPYPPGEICDGAHGAPLIPWPNRLADGRYSFGEEDLQVALNEPTKQNAIHGFLRWRPWVAIEREEDRVVMGTRLYPLEGYPFALEMRIAYELGEAGLEVSTTALNIGERPCPYGAGQHPYLSAGGGLVDECTLELPANTRVLTDNERQLPSGEGPVEGTRFDFRSARRLGEERLDYPFTDLIRDDSGRAVTRLGRPDGARAELWADEHYSYLELYTGDTLAPQRRRRGLGVEPMTCPPNAFQSGEGVITLAPGQSLTTRWGARLL